MVDSLLIPRSLEELAAEIREEHDRCIRAVRDSLTHARKCGELLLEARSQIPPRKGWLDWLSKNCQLRSKSTAYNYMRVAKEWGVLESIFPTIGNINLVTALSFLSGDDDEAAIESLAPERPDVLDADFVEVAVPAVSRPPKPPALEVGDRCAVANPANLYSGQQVEVIEKQGGFYIAQASDGKQFPFLPAELQVVESVAIVPYTPPVAAPTKTQRLRLLLERALDEVLTLPEDLRAEIQAELGM